MFQNDKHFNHERYDQSSNAKLKEMVKQSTVISDDGQSAKMEYACPLCPERRRSALMAELHLATAHFAALEEVEGIKCLYCRFMAKHTTLLKKHVMASVILNDCTTVHLLYCGIVTTLSSPEASQDNLQP